MRNGAEAVWNCFPRKDGRRKTQVLFKRNLTSLRDWMVQDLKDPRRGFNSPEKPLSVLHFTL